MRTLVDRILRETAVERHPFFTSLKDGGLSREAFVETQARFHGAVVYFARPMAAIAARIPSAELRLEVLRNVWEEHGEGDPARSHGATFQEFLSRLAGITPAEIEARDPSTAVESFNTSLWGACVLEDYLVGTAMLGIIERMFCDISHRIAVGVVERGWLQAGQMIHYDLHRELDVKHSEDFFQVLAPAWAAGTPGERALIERGFRLGASAFSRLYEELLREARA